LTSVSVRTARLLTACVVIGLCGFTAAHGLSIVRFSLARADSRTRADRAEAFRAWTATPGLAGEALRASLSNVSDPADTAAVREREDTLTALLAVHPLSSADWLALAGMRLVSRESYDKVLAALAMSSLTGPNEGGVMLQRGTFGLVQWEILPPDARRRVIADLAGTFLETTPRDGEVAPAKSVLGAKATDTRREIADLLRTAGVSTDDLARMGL
jgi:hypothetical protein